MNYVMSDIHGEYDKFLEMLQKIDLQDDDTLYILGNVVDRGEELITLIFILFGETMIELPPKF